MVKYSMQKKTIAILFLIGVIASLTTIHQVSASFPLTPEEIDLHVKVNGSEDSLTNAIYKASLTIEFRASVKCQMKVWIDNVLKYSTIVTPPNWGSYSDFKMNTALNHTITVKAIAAYPYSGSSTINRLIILRYSDVSGDPIPNQNSLGIDVIRTKSSNAENCMNAILHFVGVAKGYISGEEEYIPPNASRWLDAMWFFFSDTYRAPWGGDDEWPSDDSMGYYYNFILNKFGRPYNCWSYAGLLTSMARMVGIPARLISSAAYSSLYGDTTEHTLAEFYVNNTWNVISIRENTDTERANWEDLESDYELVQSHYAAYLQNDHNHPLCRLAIYIFWDITPSKEYGHYDRNGDYTTPTHSVRLHDAYNNNTFMDVLLND